METEKKSTSRKPRAKTAAKKNKPIMPEPVETAAPEVAVEEKPVEATPVKKRGRVPSDLMVTVVSNVANLLHYNCVRSYGEEVEWSAYGDIQELTFEELRAMKGRYPRFFKDNWVVLNDSGDYTAAELYAALGVGKDYENAITPDNMNDLLDQSSDELEDSLAALSEPMRRTVYEVANSKKEMGQFDSIAKFEIIKKAAGMSDTAR